MPRPGPARDPVPLRLSPAEKAPVEALAGELPPLPRGVPNLSAALRLLIADGLTLRARPHVAISDAGEAALDELAERAGITRDEVVRLALRYAVQHPEQWLPPTT